jgi:hypothetical protein
MLVGVCACIYTHTRAFKTTLQTRVIQIHMMQYHITRLVTPCHKLMHVCI